MSEDFKKITFVPTGLNIEHMLAEPTPATQHVPDWYKTLAKFDLSNDERELKPNNKMGSDGAVVATKQCPPFMDAMTAGYMHTLADDLHVEIDDDGKPILYWETDYMLVDVRPTIELPVPEGHHPIHYGFRMQWYYETPPGYSVLVTHPMNRYDLPFTVQSGIIESDIWGLPVFTAFFLKKGFEGTIPKGTPIFQMIPFKRDNWQMEIDKTEDEFDRHEFHAEDRRSRIHGYYKHTAWRKKIFRGLGLKND